MSSGKTMLGVLAGFAAGALVGVLLAPEKGTDTRKKLAKLGEDYAGDLNDKFNELKDQITEKLGSVQDDGMKIIEKGRNKVEDVKSQVKNTISSATSGSSGSTGSSSSSHDKWSTQNS
jgi:gas vesicle protein